MKRYIKNILMLSLVSAGFLACESSNKTIDDVFEETTRGAVFRSTSSAEEVAAQEFSFSDPSSEYSVTFEVEDNAEGELLDNVEIYTAFTSATDDDLSTSEVLVKTLLASDFTTNEDGLPSITVVLTLGELASAAGLSESDYTGGDSFSIRYVLNLTDGRSFSNDNLKSTVSGGSYYRSPFYYTVPLVCPPIAPGAGEWTIEMQDSYGDGWNGASLDVTVDGTDIGSFTLDSGSAGTATFEVPDGAEELVITFVSGAWDSEISFQIYSAAGNLKADVSPSPVAGAQALDYCVD